MTEREDGRAGASGPTEGVSPSGGLPDSELRKALAVVRRRWWLLFVGLVLSVGHTLYQQARDVPIYTAEVVLQRELERSPLGIAGLQTAQPRATLAAQIEVLKSRAVVSRVVDSLGLRAVLRGPGAVRSELFDEVRVDRDAKIGTYSVSESEGEFLLTSDETDVTLGRAAPGGWLTGPGFQIRLTPEASAPEPLTLRIVDRESAVNRLQGSLNTELVLRTNLIRARVAHPDPVRAAAIVNTLGSEFRRFSAAQARESAVRRREFLSDQLGQVADSLAQAQQTLLQYQDSSRVFNPEVESETVSQQLMAAEARLRDVRFQESVLEGLVTSLESGRGAPASFQRLQALGSDVLPAAQSMYTRLKSLQTEREDLTSTRFGMTESRPEVERLDSAIANTKEEIMVVAEQSLDLMRDRIASVEANVDELQEEVGDLPGRVTRFARLKQRVDAVQKVFDLVLGKYYEAQIAEAVEAGNVEIVDPAPVPLRPEPSNHFRELVFAILLGLAAGTGGAFLLEKLDTKIRSASDAEAVAGVGILGAIPELSRNGTGPLILADDTSDSGMEAVRVVRTNLRFSRAEEPRVVLVTSGEPAVGKSTVALNLALNRSEQKDRVLLIDADLRRPQIHEALSFPRAPGLTNVVVGECTMEEAVNTMDVGPSRKQLTVLSCGSAVPTPSELLSGGPFVRLLDEARENTDIVVIDAPPVLAVADTAIVAEAVDGAIVVVRAESTERSVLARTVEQLRRVHAPVLGVVLNEVPVHRGSHGYYRGGYYSSYGGSYDGDYSRDRPRRGWIDRVRRRLSI